MIRAAIRVGCALAASCLVAFAHAGAPHAGQVARGVDALLSQELYDDSTRLAPRADDATFLRRAMLDIVGDIPTPEHVTAFLLDPAHDKRERLVEALLDDPHYGLNWARYWRDVILYRRLEDRAVLVSEALVSRLTDDLNESIGWDEIASGFITARGDVRENGETAIIFAQDGRTEETAAEVSRIFLGVQIQCAQCHDHPWDSWRREQFHELAAFFPRVAVRPRLTPTRRSLEVYSDDAPRRRLRPNPNNSRRGSPEHYMPDLNDPQALGTRMQPRFFLTSAEMPLGARDSQRRAQLSEWLIDSPWFATALVNRMWAELVGEPFYELVDDIGPDRQAKAPQAAELLAEQFTASGYDLKWLMRTIMATDAYQRECRPRRSPDETPMTANVAQPLRGDQLYSAMLTALGIEEAGPPAQGVRVRRGGFGRRATSRAKFTSEFGYDPSVDRESVAASIPQALALMNTPQVNRAMLARKQSTLGRLVDDVGDDAALVDELYLRCLSRLPTDVERARALEYRGTVGQRAEAFEDLLWALVNSAEFAHRR